MVLVELCALTNTILTQLSTVFSLLTSNKIKQTAQCAAQFANIMNKWTRLVNQSELNIGATESETQTESVRKLAT